MSNDKLFNDNINLAYKAAHSFELRGKYIGLKIDDLIQEALVGLHKAVRDYNPEKGKFGTFVYRAIKNHMLKLFDTKKVLLMEEDWMLSTIPDLQQPITFEDLFIFRSEHQLDNEYLIGQIISKMDEVLTAEEKECILDHIHDINDREIGEMYGLTQQNISVRRKKAFQKLKEAISPSSCEVPI